MTRDDSDNFPTVIGRPVFDTMPCPRPGDFTGKDEAGSPVRVSANGRAAFPLMSPCGPVTVQEPTRAGLLLSAKQWSTRVREELHDRHGIWRSSDPVSGALDRLDAVLAELAAMEAK